MHQTNPRITSRTNSTAGSLAIVGIILTCLTITGCASVTDDFVGQSDVEPPTSSSQTPPASTPTPAHHDGDTRMNLGNFSISLAVKDLAASRAFYEKLGFRVIGGNGKNYSIMQSQTATIGLFQGMFDKNILTFNPGWDRACNTLPEFDDVREIQKSLKGQGVALTTQADESTSGPASLTLLDPDGNVILIDQHVPSPANAKK